VFGASSVEMTGGERTLLGSALLSPASLGAAGRRWAGRGLGARSGGRRSRVGRIVFGKADNVGTSNNKSTEVVSVDVGPFVSVIHSRNAGELAGGWLISASVLHVDLTTEGGTLSQRRID
jgi:hypothetical protein